MCLHHFSSLASISRLPLRRHEVPVGSSALPYNECTLWSYATTDLFAGTIDSVRNRPHHADPSASAPACSASSTSPTASIRHHFASNEFVTSNESHAQYADCPHSTPYIQPGPAWNPQSLIVAPQSYWPTSPPAVAPTGTPAEHPQSTPIHPSQPPANASPPIAVPTPTAPAVLIGQPQASPPGTSQATPAVTPTPTGTTDTTQTQAHTSTTAPNATSIPAAATLATPSTQDTTASRPPPINITVPTPWRPPTQPSPAVPTPPPPKATVRQRSTTTTPTATPPKTKQRPALSPTRPYQTHTSVIRRRPPSTIRQIHRPRGLRRPPHGHQP